VNNELQMVCKELIVA